MENKEKKVNDIGIRWKYITYMLDSPKEERNRMGQAQYWKDGDWELSKSG